MARGKKWPDVKRSLCLRRMKELMPKKGWKLTLVQVADEQEVPEWTLSHWWQQEKKKGKVRAEAKETSLPAEPEAALLVSDENLGSRAADPSPAPPPPRPPHLLINGVLRCSRCSGEHLERRGEEEFYCLICNVVLLFDGFHRERTRPFYELGKDSWML